MERKPFVVIDYPGSATEQFSNHAPARQYAWSHTARPGAECAALIDLDTRTGQLFGRCRPRYDRSGQLTLTRFCLGDDTPLEGYTQGNHWNGWACPFFTFEQAGKVCTYLETRGQCAYYVAGIDAFIILTCDPPEEIFYNCGEPELYFGEVIDGVKYYAIGNGAWIWDECDEA